MHTVFRIMLYGLGLVYVRQLASVFKLRVFERAALQESHALLRELGPVHLRLEDKRLPLEKLIDRELPKLPGSPTPGGTSQAP